MSYSRYFRIAMPHAIGTNASSRPMMLSVHEPLPCSTGRAMKATSAAAAKISHFSCCRSSLPPRRYRTKRDATLSAAQRITKSAANSRPTSKKEATPGEEYGFGTERPSAETTPAVTVHEKP